MYDKMDEKALACSLGGGSCHEDIYEFLHENITHFVYLGIGK